MKTKLLKNYFYLIVLALLCFMPSLFAVEYSITQIYESENPVYAESVEHGQIAFSAQTASEPSEIFLYNGNEVIQITNNNYSDHGPNLSNGEIFWRAYPNGVSSNTEFFHYKEGVTTQLTNTGWYKTLMDTDNGQAVWSEDVDSNSEIFYYDGTSVVQLTDDDLMHRYPSIHNGEIAWYTYDSAASSYYIYHYNGTDVIRLTDGSTMVMAPSIYNGQIIWKAYDPATTKYELYLYDGNTISQLTDNTQTENSPAIHENIIAWLVHNGQGTAELYVYENGQTSLITSKYESHFTPQVSSGSVTWYERNPNSVYVYTEGEVIQLSVDETNEYYYSNTKIDNQTVAWSYTENYPSSSSMIMLATPKGAIPGTIEAEDYNAGGEGIAYHDTDSVNNGGVYRNDGVDIQSNTPAGYSVGWTEAGEWLEYTVEVETAGNYNIELVTTSLDTEGSLHIEFDGQDVTGIIPIPVTGGWQNKSSVFVNGIDLTEGGHVMRIAIDSPGFNMDSISFTKGGSGQTPFTIHNIPGTIEAEDYDWGGQNIAYYDTDSVNGGGAAYRNDHVDIEDCSLGGYNLSHLTEGEWTEYTISTVQSGKYNIILDIASADTETSKNITIKLNGTTLGIVYPFATGGWQNWHQVSLWGIEIAGGTDQILRLEYGGQNFNVDKIKLEPIELIVNGDFNNGMAGWSTFINAGTNASIYVDQPDPDLRTEVWAVSSENYHVQAYQAGLLLETGKTYELTFDAAAVGNITSGSIDVQMEENGGDYTQYMAIQTVDVTAAMQTFTITFTMGDPTDGNGRVSFNMGKNDPGTSGLPVMISIDNVSLIQK